MRLILRLQFDFPPPERVPVILLLVLTLPRFFYFLSLLSSCCGRLRVRDFISDPTANEIKTETDCRESFPLQSTEIFFGHQQLIRNHVYVQRFESAERGKQVPWES